MAIVDAHVHLFRTHLKDMVRSMDENDIAYAVNLSWPQEEEAYAEMIRAAREETGGRIATLSNFSYEGLDRPGYAQGLVDRFRREVEAGAQGLKVLKRLGLQDKYTNGEWVRVDDERLDPLWAAAGEMGVPVLIHTADPIPAWMPIDENNPRYETYRKDTTWYFGDGTYFDRLDLLAQRDRVLERHPETVFVNAHQGCYPENLDHLVSLLERFDNFYADFNIIPFNEFPVGKTHTSYRQVLLDYQDRFLLGTDLLCRPPERPLDLPWNRGFYERIRRWQATEEGVNLPPDALRKIQYENAVRIYKLAV